MNIIKEKIKKAKELNHKFELQKLKNKYEIRNDQILVEAANNFFDQKRTEPIYVDNDLVPFTQSYKNAFMTFGYKKREK